MALTEDVQVESRGKTLHAVQVVNALQIYHGAMVGIFSRGHGTAGNRGRLTPMNDANFLQPVGRAISNVLGDTAATPVPEGQVDVSGFTWEEVTVTGVTGQLDVLRLVYMTDDNTFTLTRPTVGAPIGFIVRWHSSTTVDIQVFSLETFVALSLSGQGQVTWFLGVVGCQGTTGNMLTGIEAPYHGFITSLYGIVINQATDANVDISVNLEIGATNVTGGVVNWLFSSAIGAKLAGTAITALNEMHEGDLIDVEAVYNAAGTSTDTGLMGLYAEVQLEAGV